VQLADWVFRPGRAATVAVLLLLPLLLTLMPLDELLKKLIGIVF